MLRPLRDAYPGGGRAAVVRATLDRMRTGDGPAVHLALLCAKAGELDTALGYLDQAIGAHDPSLVDLAVGPQWGPLRADASPPAVRVSVVRGSYVERGLYVTKAG